MSRLFSTEAKSGSLVAREALRKGGRGYGKAVGVGKFVVGAEFGGGVG